MAPKAPKAPKRRTDAPPDPDKLVRRSAGSYRTADDRFEARQGAVGWFLVDSEQSNEFGQELMHGPFPTLKELRAAISGARTEKVRPMPAPAARGEGKAAKRSKASKPRAAADAPKEPAPTWIDRLPAAEGRLVRRTIAALEREGVEDAELLVRRDRDGLLPAVAVRLIERRLAQATADASAAERRLVQRVSEILSAEGRATDALPGWALVEVEPGKDPPPNRRIDLRR
jgi:hypothetical protein